MKVTLLLSGGLDSTALLFHLRAQGHSLRALAVDYGQRHRRELDSARAVAAVANVPLEVANLRGVAGLLGGSALTAPELAVPDGHYTDERMKITVVPNRNMIMLSLAVGWALSSGDDAVAYAAHAGDHTIYPDCRPAFVDALERAVALCDWRQIALLRPFVDHTKAQIVGAGVAAGAPLALTWSCYKGGALHCGTCGTCVERREAFVVAEVTDPTLYAGHAP